ncbi:methylenetetrahydrofolate reductase [Buchnera aphidicola]|uniref:methylenetetrahydrofolate reductase n=1 Tax=Buchnera aphidicola TaxID=9 RepID=UPI0031B89E21
MNILNKYNDFLQQKKSDLSSDISFSFELFPPKDFHQKNNNFLSCINKLSLFNPTFISVTCTAKNNVCNDYTYNAIRNIPKKLNLNVAPHITCINKSEEELTSLAHRYWNDGIKSVIALRGDNFLNSNRKCYAYDLVVLLKQVANFDISVAAYPEGHPEAINKKIDLMHLKRKIDCGANRAITQFFFDVDKYLRFRDECVHIGIDVDIIPGILPITNFHQLKRFVSITNVNLPDWLINLFLHIHEQDVVVSQMIGLIICVQMIQRLCLEGVKSFHFYTLNHYESVYSLCSTLKKL